MRWGIFFCIPWVQVCNLQTIVNFFPTDPFCHPVYNRCWRYIAGSILQKMYFTTAAGVDLSFSSFSPEFQGLIFYETPLSANAARRRLDKATGAHDHGPCRWSCDHERCFVRRWDTLYYDLLVSCSDGAWGCGVLYTCLCVGWAWACVHVFVIVKNMYIVI